MNIPETLIMSYEAQIQYIYTNKNGYLESRAINAEAPEAEHGCKFGTQPKASEHSLSEKAIKELIDIANYFHDCIYLKQSKSERGQKQIYPIAITKCAGEDSDNQTELQFFTGGILDHIIKNHQREYFIV